MLVSLPATLHPLHQITHQWQGFSALALAVPSFSLLLDWFLACLPVLGVLLLVKVGVEVLDLLPII